MAIPRTRRAPQNLANIGVEGRATALTMAERPKDEHGMELMDNWYSSPVKSNAKRVRSSAGLALHKPPESPQDLQNAKTTDLEAAEILTSGRLTREKRKSLLPPPHARSPIRTSLGATPIRGTPKSVASPARPQSQDPLPPKSPTRLLDFSTNENSRSSLRSSVQTTNPDTWSNPTTPQAGIRNRFTLLASAEHVSTAKTNHDTQEVSEPIPQSDVSTYDSPPPELGDDLVDPEPVEAEGEDITPELEQSQNIEQVQEPVIEEVADGDDTIASIEVGQTDNIHVDPDPPELSEEHIAATSAEPPRKPLSRKDPNRKRKAPPKASKPAAQRGNSVPRALQRQRAQTPGEEDGVLQTRSGRNVYKPLAYWKGEHALFEDHTYQQNLKQIIRMEDVTPQKRLNGRKKKRKHQVSEDSDAEEQIEEEQWEISEGIVSAPVRTWDSDINAAPPGSEFEQQVAFASARIQPRASPDNPNFFFTKTLTMPFFGAGVIEIPPGGHKGMKNSRKFQFIFFVHYGKIQVELAGTSFTITRGGIWQVPRGNFYSMSNQSEEPAKIFFAQSCELQAEPAPIPLLEGLN